MGRDQLSIISMNSSRKGLHSMAKPDRSSYLQQLLSKAQPDICLLPGDSNEKDNAVIGYGAYMVPGNQETVLLYDHQRVTMKKNVDINTFGMPGMDMSKIVCPMVEVMAPAPMNTVVKRFSLMTWHYALPDSCGVSQEELMKSLVHSAQQVALVTGAPIIIAGEMRAANMKGIVEEMNYAADRQFVEGVQPGMTQMGYSREISKTALKSQRNLFKLVMCASNHTVRVGNEPVPDCFIASKDLELSRATFMDVEQVLGRRVEMRALKEHCPTRTEINIPPRPPKHHGG